MGIIFLSMKKSMTLHVAHFLFQFIHFQGPFSVLMIVYPPQLYGSPERFEVRPEKLYILEAAADTYYNVIVLFQYDTFSRIWKKLCALSGP